MVTVLSVCSAFAGIPDENKVFLNETSSGMELENGKAYYLSGNSLLLQGSTGHSALIVPEGVTAYLFVNANQSLVCRGGDGDLQTGGGAGIEIRPGAKLYILGGGVVSAYGGNSGVGSRGQDGTSGKVMTNSRKYIGGNGGAGGAGGGGAGAGIGGRGGYGGDGAKGQPSGGLIDAVPYGESWYNGVTGDNAPDAGDGDGMGELCVIGTTIVSAYPGKSAAEEATSITSSGTTEEEDINSAFDNTYVAGGGGGGGNGATGKAAPLGIGGGAGAGAGGGAGSSGATFNYYLNFDWNFFIHFAIDESISILINTVSAGFAEGIKDIVKYSMKAADSIVNWATDFKDYNFTDTDYSLDGSHGMGALNPSGNFFPINYVDHTGVKEYTTLSGKYQVMTPAGSFAGFNGQNGKRSSFVKTLYTPTVNSYMLDGNPEPQDSLIEKLTEMPAELREVLGTTLTFGMDNVGKGGDVVDGSARVAICLGDNLPALSVDQLPVHKDDVDGTGKVVENPKYAFGGYCDGNGNRWYNEKGEIVLDGGKFLSLDSVCLTPVWENNVYLLVVHSRESVDSEDSNDTSYPNYVPFKIDILSRSIYTKEGEPADNVEFTFYSLQGDNPDADHYSSMVTGFTAMNGWNKIDIAKKDFHQITGDDLPITDEWAKQYKSLANAAVTYVNYKRNAFDIAWNIPDGTEIADSDEKGSRYYHPYTKNVSHVKFGAAIVPPMFVTQNGADGHGAKIINGWKRLDADKHEESVNPASMFTMPNHAVFFTPEFKPVMIDVAVSSENGVVKFDGVESLAQLQANTDVDFTVTPEDGWAVDNHTGITAVSYFRSADGAVFADTTQLFELSGQANRFSLPVRGESMKVTVNYMPQNVTLTVKQPMNGSAVSSSTFVRTALSDKSWNVQSTETATYDAFCGNYARIYMAPQSDNDRINYSNIKVCKGNDASGEAIAYTMGIDKRQGENTDVAIRYIEFKMPNSPVFASYGLSEFKTNSVTMIVPEGVAINYGHMDVDLKPYENVNGGAATWTDTQVYNDDKLFIQYSEDLRAHAYTIVGGEQQSAEGLLKVVFRKIGEKVVKGYLLQIPADANGQQYFVEAAMSGIVAIEEEPAELNAENDGPVVRTAFRRVNNDINIEIFDDASDFRVPQGNEATPIAEGGLSAEESFLHVSILKNYTDQLWHPICIPATFEVNDKILEQCVIAEEKSMVKREGSQFYTVLYDTLKLGDVVQANMPYIISMKQPGLLNLAFDTKKWENTVPVSRVIPSPVEGEELTLIPVYSETHPAELYPDRDEKTYLWKLQDNQFKYILKPTVRIAPLEFYGYQKFNTLDSRLEVASDRTGDGLADNHIMDFLSSDDPTDVHSVNNDETDEPAINILDIAGRPARSPRLARGLYIMNNQKVYVK